MTNGTAEPSEPPHGEGPAMHKATIDRLVRSALSLVMCLALSALLAPMTTRRAEAEEPATDEQYSSCSDDLTQLDISGGGCTVIVPYSVYVEGVVYEPHPSSVTYKVADGKVLTLAEDTDYTCVSWEHHGTERFGYVTIEGLGNFKGQMRSRFEIIDDGDLSRASVHDIPDEVFTGAPIEPELKVRLYNTDRLARRDTEFSAKFINNVNVGEASVELTGLGEIDGHSAATFKIVQADIKDAVVTAPDQVYGGTASEPAPTVTWNEMPLEKGKDYEVTNYADNVHVGTATITIEGKGNFKGTASGTFKITKRPLVVTADSAKRAYDGTPLTRDTFTSTELGVGDSITATVTGSQTTVGKSDNVPSAAKVVDSSGTDVTNNYDITYANGTLEVTKPHVTVTITGKKGSKPHNGKEQRVEGYAVSIDNELYKEADFTFSGEAVAKGTAVGTYPMGLAESQFTNTNPIFDVTFKVTDGSLEVEASEATLAFELAGGKLEGKTGTIFVKAKIGDSIKLPDAPTRDGYTFEYWKGSKYGAGATYVVERDHTFTAVWKKTAKPEPGPRSKQPGPRSKQLPQTGDPTAPATSLMLTGLGLLTLASIVRSRRAGR